MASVRLRPIRSIRGGLDAHVRRTPIHEAVQNIHQDVLLRLPVGRAELTLHLLEILDDRRSIRSLVEEINRKRMKLLERFGRVKGQFNSFIDSH